MHGSQIVGLGNRQIGLRSKRIAVGAYEFNVDRDLALQKTDDGSDAIAGDTYTYTLMVTNQGPEDSAGSTITDTLPTGWSFVSGSGCASAAGGFTCSVSALLVSASQSFVVTVAVPADAAEATVTNTATVSSSEPDALTSNNSDSETTTVVRRTDLVLDKSDDGSTATAGSNYSYTLQVTNDGPSDSSGGSLSDTLPAGWSFVSGAGCSATAGGFDCLVGALNSGAMQSFTVSVAVPADASGTFTNSASVTANETDPNGGNNTDTEMTTVAASTDLALDKSDDGSNAVAGGIYDYTLTVSNLGPSNASGGTVSDTLPAGWSFVSGSGCIGTAGGFDCAVGALAPTAMQSYTVTVAVPANALATVTNTATVMANEADPVAGNNGDSESTDISRSTDLALDKSDDGSNAVAGSNYVYTLSVNNLGPSDSSGGTVSDTLPAGWNFVSGAGCSTTANGFDCSVGALALNATQSFMVTVAAPADAVGTVTNQATLAANESDPQAANNVDSEDTDVDAEADLSLSNDDGVTTAIPGETVTYVIIASNAGPSDAPGSTVSDVFPAACTSVAWTCSGANGGSCTASGSGNLSDAVNLPAGSSVSYSAVCTINSATTGSLVNTATVSAATSVTDPDNGNNSATDTDMLQATADLAISKDDGVTTAIPGESVTYAIVASNAGPSDAPGSTVSDAFPAACTSVAWTCSGANGGSCTASGSGDLSDVVILPAGSSVSFSAVCTINSAATGTLVNTANVSLVASVNDPDGGNNSATGRWA